MKAMRKGKNVSTSCVSVQMKNVRSANVLSSTGVAAHANDEVEVEGEKIEEIEN